METSASTDTAPTDTAATVVRRMYDAYNRKDIDAVLACWDPAGTEFLPLVGEMRARDQLGPHLRGFYAAFPDATTSVTQLLETPDGRVAVQVQLTGTFTGSHFQGLRANGRAWSARMAEFFTVEDGLIVRMDAYMDSMDLAQQLDLLPPNGSRVEAVMRRVFNAKVATQQLLHRRGRAR